MGNTKKIIIGVIIALVVLGVLLSKNHEKKEETSKLKDSDRITVAPTMNDTITSDSIWCGTFQLIWNDLKNDYVKKDIEFNPQIEIVKNLNKSDFNTNMISEDSYYKKAGEMTKQLKSEIEKGIKDKLNETSEILDSFNWKDKTEDIILYAMLKKEFEFENEFDKLDNSLFNEKYENVKYFGINDLSDSDIRKQVDVLYYHDMEDFIVRINSKQKDQVIVYKTDELQNFETIYNEIKQKQTSYTGEKTFNSKDTLRIPELKVASKKNYVELINKRFKFADGGEHVITQAVQTIEFELNSKGGKVKSEAGMGIARTAINLDEIREFNVDGTFYIFLKEKDKEKPYLAARVNDITKFQN